MSSVLLPINELRLKVRYSEKSGLISLDLQDTSKSTLGLLNIYAQSNNIPTSFHIYTSTFSIETLHMLLKIEDIFLTECMKNLSPRGIMDILTFRLPNIQVCLL
jgi:hypothetical protein